MPPPSRPRSSAPVRLEQELLHPQPRAAARTPLDARRSDWDDPRVRRQRLRREICQLEAELLQLAAPADTAIPSPLRFATPHEQTGIPEIDHVLRPGALGDRTESGRPAGQRRTA
ncbi:MAG: hypothetical protein JNG83_07410 [Opitutaceae bacterium]|nr:hypothetical protein [Opitutaceae bacterium]